jgi:hypothetical protein
VTEILLHNDFEDIALDSIDIVYIPSNFLEVYSLIFRPNILLFITPLQTLKQSTRFQTISIITEIHDNRAKVTEVLLNHNKKLFIKQMKIPESKNNDTPLHTAARLGKGKGKDRSTERRQSIHNLFLA